MEKNEKIFLIVGTFLAIIFSVIFVFYSFFSSGTSFLDNSQKYGGYGVQALILYPISSVLFFLSFFGTIVFINHHTSNRRERIISTLVAIPIILFIWGIVVLSILIYIL